MRQSMRRNTQGQATIEYILLLFIVVSAFLMVLSVLGQIDIQKKIIVSLI